jgi:orotate phosphoribosyltransferase
VSVLDAHTNDLEAAHRRLVSELREHALVIGRVTLTSGREAEYYVDAKRAILRPAGFAALGAVLGAQLADWGATAVGGMTMGADPVACAALAFAGSWSPAAPAGAKAFFVRKDAKAHGLQRRVEGPLLDDTDRCVIVEDVTTTGGSALAAIAALQEEGRRICGVVTVLDRLAGAAEAIEAVAGAPYRALTTIDDIYPDRPEET